MEPKTAMVAVQEPVTQMREKLVEVPTGEYQITH